MANYSKPEPSQEINLVYIRAAIEANTGIRLSLEQTRKYLVEEKLITPYQAKNHAHVFRGYSEYFDLEEYTVEKVHLGDVEIIL